MTAVPIKRKTKTVSNDPRKYIAALLEMNCDTLTDQYFVVGRLVEQYAAEDKNDERVQAMVFMQAIAAIGRALYGVTFSDMLLTKAGK